MTTQISSDNIQQSTLDILGGTAKITSVQIADSSYSILDDTAISTDGGYIVINGTRFKTGCQVIIQETLATSVIVVSSTVLHVQVPAKAAGTYDVYAVNTDGETAIGLRGITYSSTPMWVTGSTLPSQPTGESISIQLQATGAVSYSLQAGSTLPTGLSLSSGGLLSGTVTVANTTSYNFTIIASDNELQDSPRTFSLEISTYIAPTTIEYFAVAAGGGGAGSIGGGGAAGGYVTASGVSISTGVTYTVVIGTGGTGATGTVQGGNGGNSTISGSGFTTVTAVGGGGGGYYNGSSSTNGSNGGSGGGAAGTGSGQGKVGGKGIYPGSTYISATRQGYDGGNSWAQDSAGSGGGGGGAGAAGANGAANTGGAGGIGIQSSISGTNTYYAGGGGAGGSSTPGTGGNGGGGAGVATGTGNSGTVNTGGGGGGAGGTGGNGGSGVVFVRYPDSYSQASSTTGSPTITVTGGYVIYKFTGSGSITF